MKRKRSFRRLLRSVAAGEEITAEAHAKTRGLWRYDQDCRWLRCAVAGRDFGCM